MAPDTLWSHTHLHVTLAKRDLRTLAAGRWALSWGQLLEDGLLLTSCAALELDPGCGALLHPGHCCPRAAPLLLATFQTRWLSISWLSIGRKRSGTSHGATFGVPTLRSSDFVALGPALPSTGRLGGQAQDYGLNARAQPLLGGGRGLVWGCRVQAGLLDFSVTVWNFLPPCLSCWAP